MPFYVYILASRTYGTLYIGVTNDIGRRVWEHKEKLQKGFTATYAIDRLVWYETYDRIDEAIGREKSLKKWRRDWKIRLIEDENPIGSISTNCSTDNLRRRHSGARSEPGI
jgi:putative endonuclease